MKTDGAGNLGWANPAGATQEGLFVFDALDVCGTGTEYLGPYQSACNATESLVQFTVPQALTVQAMTCVQKTDGSCVAIFTLRKNNADTTTLCTDTNHGGCAYSATTVSYAASDTMSIKFFDSLSTCGIGNDTTCRVRYTIP